MLSFFYKLLTICEDVKIAQWVKDAETLDKLTLNHARKVGAPVKLGSNTWTLAPDITGTGFPILVGQPQMGHSVPSIIFEAALQKIRCQILISD